MIIPNRLSALIRLAVADSIKIETTPGYELNMDRWHFPKFVDESVSYDAFGKEPVEACQVCMAGAVLSQSFGAKRYQNLNPESGSEDCNFGRAERNMCRAIDHVRRGGMDQAAMYFLGTAEDGVVGTLKDLKESDLEVLAAAQQVILAGFVHDLGRAEWSTYLDVANYLESEGL